MKKKIELIFLVLFVVFGLSGVLFADITSGGADVSALGDYASEYRVDADQPENTNNCTMNSMEGSTAPDTPLDNPNNWAITAPQPFVEDVWDASNPVSNDDPTIPPPRYYPDTPPPPPPDTPATPEPATIFVVCAGMCGLAMFKRRKRTK
ncbi:MAG: PEP-CTERM sorting domain-containing protein [Planctomycetaceae bacterium]|nr:PEP-CTERM sorting domain-containing protein [Planctomycetaceae bacterium]